MDSSQFFESACKSDAGPRSAIGVSDGLPGGDEADSIVRSRISREFHRASIGASAMKQPSFLARNYGGQSRAAFLSREFIVRAPSSPRTDARVFPHAAE